MFERMKIEHHLQKLKVHACACNTVFIFLRQSTSEIEKAEDVDFATSTTKTMKFLWHNAV